MIIVKTFIALLIFSFSFNAYPETMSGPRFGITYLSPKTMDLASKNGADIAPVVTQFGWHFERKFLTTKSGPEGVTALIPLIGGMEQGVIIPSLSWITGLRLRNGHEFGIGPNASIGTLGMTLVFGHSGKLGSLYIPKNVALALSPDGFQLSFMFGFNSSNKYK